MQEQPIRIGLVGYGEVGSTFARGWRECNSLLDIFAFDLVWTRARIEQAKGLNVEIAQTIQDLVEKSNLIICAVVPQAATDAVKSAAPFLSHRHLYVDATSAGPAKSIEISKIVGGSGAKFAKLALMGAVAAFGYQVPMVTSGVGATALTDSLLLLGMNISAINDDPAAAATLKLCRSLFQKGIVALALEALLVAKKNGVEAQVVASLAETWNAEGFEGALNRLICSSTTHAKRRAAELDEALSAFAEMEIDLPVARASRKGFQLLVELQDQDFFGGKQPKEFELVLDALEEKQAHRV